MFDHFDHFVAAFLRPFHPVCLDQPHQAAMTGIEFYSPRALSAGGGVSHAILLASAVTISMRGLVLARPRG